MRWLQSLFLKRCCLFADDEAAAGATVDTGRNLPESRPRLGNVKKVIYINSHPPHPHLKKKIKINKNKTQTHKAAAAAAATLVKEGRVWGGKTKQDFTGLIYDFHSTARHLSSFICSPGSCLNSEQCYITI